MRSPKQRLAEAIEAWRRREAREQIARWRGDPDAPPAGAPNVERARLTSPRARDLFEESAERGLFDAGERSAVLRGLLDATLWPARAAGAQFVQAALGAPVPYDSNHHRGGVLLERITIFDDARKRRGMGSALRPTFEALLGARREARARIEEALDDSAWLRENEPEPQDHPPGELEEAALATLDATDDAWQEVLSRLSHASQIPAEQWTDLLRILREPRWDDSVPPRTRARRLARHLGPLGLAEVLRRRARLEPPSAAPRASVLVVEVREDLRISPGRELGVASERDTLAALGRAAALLLAHPALPHHLARAPAVSVARTVGALLAHLYADPVFTAHGLPSLSTAERRSVQELALGLELFELRTAAASCACARHLERTDFLDAARTRLVRAWTVDLPPTLAGVVCDDSDAQPRLRTARLAPALAIALREHFDEDFWRNPRTAEPIRHAAARGSELQPDAWAEELGASPDALEARMTELLS